MTTVTIIIDGFTVTASHPIEGPTVDQVVALVHSALCGHRYSLKCIDACLDYDEDALIEVEAES